MITHVAILHRGKLYSLPKPNRHHHVIHMIYEAIGEPVSGEKQGFLDDLGNFLDRRQALAHAIECNQLLNPDNHHPTELFSEDVWITAARSSS